MDESEKKISKQLKEFEKMIKNKKSKKEVEEKRKELDKLLEKYLENLK